VHAAEAWLDETQSTFLLQALSSSGTRAQNSPSRQMDDSVPVVNVTRMPYNDFGIPFDPTMQHVDTTIWEVSDVVCN
jgi:hypothetical protein